MRSSLTHSARVSRRTGFIGALSTAPTEDAPEGDPVLREVPGAAGVLLWGALRDVMLWAEAAPPARSRLFAAGAEVERIEPIYEAAVEGSLRATLLELAFVAGGNTTPEFLAACCTRIAAWAEGGGAARTRLAFTRAAALLRPADARLALETGRLARDLGYPAHAESWLRRAITTARGQDWETYVWGYVYLAWIYWRAGNLVGALSIAERALRKSRRHRLRTAEGFAYHSIFVFVSDQDARKAYESARGALRAFGAEHPRVPILAQDVATYWADRGQYARALPVIEAVLPRIASVNERGLVMAGLARAGAGAGQRRVYEQSRAEALRTLSAAPSEARQAEAFVVLARADRLAGEWARAEEAARKALVVAARRGEGLVRSAAEVELDAATAGLVSTAEAPSDESPGLARQAARLQEDLIQSLRTAAPGATAGSG